jgi:hypothetical protein
MPEAYRVRYRGNMLRTGIGLLLTLASAGALNLAYVIEHDAARTLPPLSVRRPWRAVRLLLSNRQWVAGFVTEGTAWALYVAALAAAPLALVQAVSAGGIGVLAVLTSRLSGIPLSTRERLGVWTAVLGLGLLGISLAGGSTSEGSAGAWLTIWLWIAASAGAAFLVGRFGQRALGAGAALGIATGILFAAGDVTTKTVVHGGSRLLFVPAMLGAYGFGSIVLQLGFQRGGALRTAGLATLFTNALPIAAGMTIYGEPLPDGEFAVLRVLSFAAVVAGAVALARPEKAEREGDAEPLPLQEPTGQQLA